MSGPYSSLLGNLQRETRSYPTAILHYDPEAFEFRVWFWPLTRSGQRVNPTELWRYRDTHHFQAPCCLCASSAGGIYTESAIYRAVNGPYAGEYITGCASGRCGYLVALERMFTRRGLLVDSYPIRGSCAGSAGEGASNLVLSSAGEVEHSHPLPVGELVAANDIVPTYERPIRVGTVLKRLMRLNSSIRPGLSETEFRRLFAKCHCGLIMTQRVFADHVCRVVDPVVIDLTGDSDAD